jgi:hypothetical protein
MRTVPHEIIDAARVDGCNEFRIYWQIILPLTLPALAALATLEFTWVFNDYLWAIILLRSDTLRPVTAGLATLRGQFNTDWPVITAGACGTTDADCVRLPTTLFIRVTLAWQINQLSLLFKGVNDFILIEHNRPINDWENPQQGESFNKLPARCLILLDRPALCRREESPVLVSDDGNSNLSPPCRARGFTGPILTPPIGQK